MKLTSEELKLIYQSVVKPFGHPDPVGFMVRALIESEGDPDYWGADDRVGFMPVDPSLALEMIGAKNVTDLQTNIMATMTMDQMFFEKYGSIDSMITAFHFGEDMAFQEAPESQKFINEVDNNRGPMLEILSPRQATLQDIVSILNDGLKKPSGGKMVEKLIVAVLKD